MSEPVVSCTGLKKTFRQGDLAVPVLLGIDLAVARGERIAVVGASGSGKSTLLHLLGGLDAPSEGTVTLLGRDLAKVGEAERGRLRNQSLGFIYQFHHLLPEFSALENVAMPGLIAGMQRADALSKARESLELLGLEQRLHHRVTTLSGGERQRAAIARAVLMGPKVLLADEPTGNLDEATGQRAGELLARLNRDLGMTLIVVTHNHNLARLMGRRMELHGGDLLERD